uniref:Nucleoprotein n=1 Tax=Goettingen orthomyxo-like virus TaxID=2789610 RepID=A0A7S8ZXD2_9ORTO|nr:nucleoprotein [Goettingen orthomyxo-like virus]
MSSKAVKDITKVQNFYKALRDTMRKYLPVVSVGHEAMFDRNCRKVFKIVLKCFDPKADSTVNPMRKVEQEITIKMFYTSAEAIAAGDGIAEIAGKFYKIEEKDVIIKFVEVRAALKDAIKVYFPTIDISAQVVGGVNNWKSTIFPLVATGYKMINMLDEVYFSNNDKTQREGYDSNPAPLTTGRTVANRWKKARPLSFGPTLNIMSLMRAQRLIDTRPSGPPRAKKARLAVGGQSNLALDESNLRVLDKIMKKQLIGTVQKEMLTEAVTNKDRKKYEMVIGSLNTIKARITHKFFVHPAILVRLTDDLLKNASMSGIWPYNTWNSGAQEVIWNIHDSCPNGPAQAAFHCMFQSTYENLHVLDWMLGLSDFFLKRSELPAHPHKGTNFGYSKGMIIVRGSTALKGAAVNRGIPISSVSMVACQPSFSGKRPKLDKRAVIADIMNNAKNSTYSSGDIDERLIAEVEEYANIDEEGTCAWHTLGQWTGKNSDSTGEIVCAQVPSSSILAYSSTSAINRSSISPDE